MDFIEGTVGDTVLKNMIVNYETPRIQNKE